MSEIYMYLNMSYFEALGHKTNADSIAVRVGYYNHFVT